MGITVPPQAVIFDLGRVLVDFDWSDVVEAAVADCPLTPEEFKAMVLQGPLLQDFETGRLDAVEFHAGLERILAGPFPFECFCSLWNGIFRAPIGETCRLARALNRSAAVKVAILSNTNALHAAYLRERMPVLGELEHIYLSHEIGWRKPAPEAYRYVLERLAVPAKETVFIDDLPENVAAAEACGMRGILAQSAAAVAAGLRAQGLPA